MKPIALLLFLALPQILSAENKLESWYTYWGTGYANSRYADQLQDTLDELEASPGVSHTPFAADLLGFYWPHGENTIVGGIINAAVDIYERDQTKADISTFLYSVSMMHFFQKRIGQGLFVRADLGAARHVIELKEGKISITDASDWGTGLLVGGGYGFSVTAGTRILAQVALVARRVAGENSSTLAITVGGLF